MACGLIQKRKGIVSVKGQSQYVIDAWLEESVVAVKHCGKDETETKESEEEEV